jgi:hypothetical protein
LPPAVLQERFAALQARVQSEAKAYVDSKHPLPSKTKEGLLQQLANARGLKHVEKIEWTPKFIFETKLHTKQHVPRVKAFALLRHQDISALLAKTKTFLPAARADEPKGLPPLTIAMYRSVRDSLAQWVGSPNHPLLCHYLIYQGHLPIGNNATLKLSGLTKCNFDASTDFTRAFHLVKEALQEDEYSAAFVPDAIYFARHDHRSLAASFDTHDFKQRLLVFVGRNHVRVFRLPELANQAVHLGNEIAQAVSITVSAKEAVFEGLSLQGAAVLQNDGIVIRIGRNDRCSIVANDHHTTVGLSAGFPWAPLLALVLHGHAPEALHPSRAPHLAQQYRAAMSHSFTAKSDEALAHTAARWIAHASRFDAAPHGQHRQHRFYFCKVDPDTYPPRRPNPGKVGEQLFDATPTGQTYSGSVNLVLPAGSTLRPQRITFVYAEGRYISEIWVEQDLDHDDDI